jgi:hypothetical protein
VIADNHQLLLDMLDPSSPCNMSDLERMTRFDRSLTTCNCESALQPAKQSRVCCHRILPRRVVVLSHGQGKQQLFEAVCGGSKLWIALQVGAQIHNCSRGLLQRTLRRFIIKESWGKHSVNHSWVVVSDRSNLVIRSRVCGGSKLWIALQVGAQIHNCSRGLLQRTDNHQLLLDGGR